ncbi:hypothetical protein JAAARDRAFT_204621 [Jaapia argillacea MUCL 33604]|uniref:Nuclear rim protein 1 n=1 Tax=Jaapia argillacea MUCL 33604 TaxID=933084 RepID=A0A067QBC3_9AGAM|nr:hypothetical protein JAAARDRAFT_204621 [Jaapia argillacea MUCL 33604]
MSLRRFAFNNNVAGTNASPRASTSSTPASPVVPAPPTTPRNRPYHYSPAATPSISSSVPFDWEAAKSRRPPPYSTPIGKRRGPRKSEVGATPRRIVRKKGFFEKVASIPSTIAFEIALFPDNVPRPKPATSAWLIGGSMHFLHLCIRVSQIRKVPDSDTGWEDMYREGEGQSWFDWTVPMTLLLIIASVMNAIYLFSRIKLYHLHNQHDPVSSPHASFVPMHLDFEPLEPPSLFSRIRSAIWSGFISFWRFLLNMSPRAASVGGRMEKVQQLQVWTPGELEMKLFCVYSPVSALLWMATTSANWMMMVVVMVVVGAQMEVLAISYEALLKDRKIISEEVMHEYNNKFVYPRVNPIRKDVAVMTHEAEVFNYDDDE